jgi:hypothetical protein
LVITRGSRTSKDPFFRLSASGAAALVPFKGLKALVEDGMAAQQIGRVYGVSRDLVIFRAKVTKLYRRLRR